MQPVIRYATYNDLIAMHLITVRAHQLSYENLIPQTRRRDFNERYTSSPQLTGRYVTRMKKRLKDAEWTVWVATIDNAVVGYTLAQRAGEHLVLKKGLFVDPDHQGQGIGKTLFESSLEIAESGDIVRLLVIEGNARAKRLYEKHGFTSVGRHPYDFFGARQEVMELSVD